MKMFWSYTNEFRYNWRGKLDISEIIDIFTGEGIENMLPESQMWFCMNFNLGVVYFPVKHSCLYNKKLFWRPNLRRFFYCLFYFFCHLWDGHTWIFSVHQKNLVISIYLLFIYLLIDDTCSCYILQVYIFMSNVFVMLKFISVSQ